jgi:hypothetical protein
MTFQYANIIWRFGCAGGNHEKQVIGPALMHQHRQTSSFIMLSQNIIQPHHHLLQSVS